jgi:hypothetical protein
MFESLSRTWTPTAYLTLESDVPAEAEAPLDRGLNPERYGHS